MKGSTDHYDGALLEAINHKIDAVLEGQQAMATIPGDVAQLKSDMFEVKYRLDSIEAVLTVHSSQINDLGDRMSGLEGHFA
ncbi:MAG: hypothetical protein AAB436_01150 [Patescibacteria group bacterium]